MDIGTVSKVVEIKDKATNNPPTKSKPSDKDKIQKESVCKCTHHDYSIGSYKEIDSALYCKSGNELNGTKCAGLNCCNIFVASKTNDTMKDNVSKEIVPSEKSIVMACMHVNNCDHALCKICYTKLLMSSDATGKGCRRSRRSRNEE